VFSNMVFDLRNYIVRYLLTPYFTFFLVHGIE
jgi:hypothetical protein